jgi:hypothetical protein
MDILFENQPLKILDELREHIIPLTGVELAQLEKRLLQEGCRDPLSVWERQEDELVIVDWVASRAYRRPE